MTDIFKDVMDSEQPENVPENVPETSVPREITLCRFYNTPTGCKDNDACTFTHSRVCIFYPNCWRGDQCFYPHVDPEGPLPSVCEIPDCPRFTETGYTQCKMCRMNSQVFRLTALRTLAPTCRWCFATLENGHCIHCGHVCASRNCENFTYQTWCKTCYIQRTKCSVCKMKKIAGQCPECEGHACATPECTNKAVKEYCQPCYMAQQEEKNVQGMLTCEHCHTVIMPGNLCWCTHNNMIHPSPYLLNLQQFLPLDTTV